MVKIQLSFKYAVFNVFRYTFFYKAKLKSDVTLRKTDNNTNTKKIWIQCKQTLLLIQYIYIYIYIKFRYDNVDTNIKDLCNKMTWIRKYVLDI